MRILFVNRMLGLSRGGGETFDLEIGHQLSLRGHEVSYLAGRPLLRRPRVSHKSRRVSWLRTPDLSWIPWDRMRGGWRLRMLDFGTFEVLASWWVKRHEQEYDVVQVCELPRFTSRYKGKLAGRLPVVMRLTAPDFYDPCGGISAADAVVAAGDSVRELEWRGIACHDVPNAVDTSRFQPGDSPFRSEQGIPANCFVVLMVARFHYVKRHDLLLEAFWGLLQAGVEARLVLAGSGPLESRTRRMAKRMGIRGRVIFLGETPHERLPDVYRAADVLVICSEYESFCFAALEGMASALPIITTDTNWVPHLVAEPEGGLVVPRGDALALAGALRTLAGDAELRQRMGRRNRGVAEKEYGWDKSVECLLGVYRNVHSAQR